MSCIDVKIRCLNVTPTIGVQEKNVPVYIRASSAEGSISLYSHIVCTLAKFVSCFGNGKWMDDIGWIDNEGWKNN